MGNEHELDGGECPECEDRIEYFPELAVIADTVEGILPKARKCIVRLETLFRKIDETIAGINKAPQGRGG